MQIFQIAATILFYAWIWIAWKLSLWMHTLFETRIYIRIYLSYVERFLNIEKNLQSSFRYTPLNFQLQFYLNSFKLLLIKKNRIYHSIFQKLNNFTPLWNLIPMNNHWLPFHSIVQLDQVVSWQISLLYHDPLSAIYKYWQWKIWHRYSCHPSFCNAH